MSTALLVGSGGREHALLWKLLQSPRCSKWIVAPGNDAMEIGVPDGKSLERWDLPGASGYAEFSRRAKEAGVSFALIGPDNPLADGIADALRAAGVLTFGPSQAAAQLEASKAFAKEVMRAAGVSTGRFRLFSEEADARRFLETVAWGPGWVLKADGLALGKGVVVCDSREQALQALAGLIRISGKLLVEEKLSGREVSWMALCDGDTCALLEPARDFKRLRDGDQGPNTGGMGAFSPVPEARDPFWSDFVREKVFLPVLREMKLRGTPFQGVLYAGLMVDFPARKLWVIEFNARFGDPEAQVLLARMDADLFEWAEACARGGLADMPKQVPFRREAAVIVVEAAEGYPDAPKKGAPIEGLESALRGNAPGAESRVFVAGAKRAENGEWQSSGGRVLGLVGTGRNLEAARKKAYALVEKVRFPGMQVRRDVARQASEEEGA